MSINMSEEFSQIELKRECVYTKIVLFEKYMPITIIDTLSLYKDTESVWLNQEILRTTETCFKIIGITTGIM